uniref:Box C/D snoRNA protein 1 n=1 Tax=Lepisosteus oculatus TaxID=7918 RepID=W5MDM0_LEPOC|nr:PREDICTED: box C/D snoRNA protein 1 [Lepisosteus oculatus]
MEREITPENQNDLDNTTDTTRGIKRKISLSNCEACGSEEARYRCPRCLRPSCSLSCVKRHKSDSGCSGVRDKTAFVPVADFDEMNLLCDYRFLEDAGRLADSAGRDSLIHRPLSTKNLNFMRNQARRFHLDLKFLPVGFSKRKENSTFFHKKEQRFFWHLKLVFPQSHTEYVERRVPEDRTLEQILAPFIHATESEPVRRQKLKVYQHAPLDHVRIFMKAENRQSNSVRYHELFLQKTLLESLRHKTVIEYPVLHVVLKDHADQYIPLGQESGAAHRGPAEGTREEEEEQEEGELVDDD